jgi:polyhydroxybutyrate depolymerase
MAQVFMFRVVFGIALWGCSPVGAEPSPLYLESERAPAVPQPTRRMAERPPILASPTPDSSTNASGEAGEVVPGQGGAPPLSFGGDSRDGAVGGAGGAATAAIGSGGTMEPSGDAPAIPDQRSPGCALAAPAITSGTHTLGVGADLRSYDVVLPSNVGSPAPVLIALHGYTMSSADMAAMTGWSALAELEGVVVVYPRGAGAVAGWNAGGCCGLDSERRDVELIDALLDTLEAAACIDTARVYVAGFSNGGMLAYRLACERSERFAAVASVAGSLAVPFGDCTPSRALPLLHVHGTADAVVPYRGGRAAALLQGPLGGPGPTFPSVEALVERISTLNGCTSAATTLLESGAALCTERAQCASGAPVELCTLIGGAHVWPGDARVPALAGGFPASDYVWEFLASQRAVLP